MDVVNGPLKRFLEFSYSALLKNIVPFIGIINTLSINFSFLVSSPEIHYSLKISGHEKNYSTSLPD
jgi:hypothetical protein